MAETADEGAILGHPGTVLDGRWELGEPLGRGAFGAVHAGRDLLTGAAVAVKRLRPAQHGSGDARESTALRLLRVPGVVRLLDEFTHEGARFLVLERAYGRPFPGLAPGAGASPSWTSIALPARRLLAILARVHAAGLLHLDLKPANVLVDDDARPRVLDLGIAAGRAFAPWDGEERSGSGTPRYAAPEQFLGRPVDARTDLYAVGVMIYEALTGRVPSDVQAFVEGGAEERLSGAPPVLEPFATSSEAARICAALLAPAPAARPASALLALALFGEDAPASTALPPGPRGEAYDAEELRDLFHGPDRLLHLREDAAAELFTRTGGRVERVRAELASWIDTGLAAWDGARMVLSRRDLGLLREEHAAEATAGLDAERQRAHHARRAEQLTPGDAGRFLSLVLAERRAEAPREALVRSRRLLDRGEIEPAIVVLFEGLSILEQDGEQPGEPSGAELLLQWVAAALASQSERQLALIRERIAPLRASDRRLESAVELIEGALSALSTDGARAIQRLEKLGSLADERLEASRLVFLALAARHVPEDEEARVLERCMPRVDDASPPMIRRVVAELSGRRLYRLGRFAEAAEEHERAEQLTAARAARLVSSLNAASAWLEAGEIARARAGARAARAAAEALRAATHEAHATWLERTAAYRAGEDQAPDLELLAALDQLGHAGFEAQIRFHEGVLAWRMGADELARELAGAAERMWSARGRAIPAALARLLAHEAGAALAPPAREALATLTDGVADASLRAQLGGLLARAGEASRPEWRAALAQLTGPATLRWEVLSLAELRAALQE